AAAEMPLGRAFLAVDHRVPDANRAPARDFKTVGNAHDVDRIPAAARALAADRAIAALVGVGAVAVEGKPDRAAAAGAFETHRHWRYSGIGISCFFRKMRWWSGG